MANLPERTQRIVEHWQLFQAIANHSAALIWSITPGGELTFVNGEAGQLLAASPHENILGRNLYDFLPPDLARQHQEHDRAVLAQSTPLHFEEEFFCRGERRTFLSVKFPLQNDSGAIGEIGCIALDITEKKQIEQARRQSEERFRLIADFTYNWEYWISPEGDYLYVSPACEKITGYGPEHFRTSKQLLKLVHPEDREKVSDHLEDCFKEELAAVELEFRIINRDGEERWVAHACQPVYGREGVYMGRRASNRDITERQRLEQELLKAQRLESIGLLAGGIAHDFNNILTAILGNIELAKMFLQPDQKPFERLAIAEEAALRARGITQQLLTFAKGGAPIKKTIAISSLLGESVKLALRGTSVKGEFSFPGDLWAVEADDNQLRQVINNLVLNAVEAMPEGGVFAVEARNEIVPAKNHLDLEEGKYVRIDLTDQGMGIPREHLPLVFDPYFSTKENGSGLGLAVSFSIVRRHGGALTVQSAPGKGTTFSLFLPASEERESEPAKPAHLETPSGQGRILVMDDDETVNEVASDMLGHLGYRTATVPDGAAAVKAYAEAIKDGDPFDAVITDLTVPAGLGGKETVRRLRELDPDARVIVSSGYANDPIMSEYTAYGFKGVIPKPYKLAELGTLLQEVLGGN